MARGTSVNYSASGTQFTYATAGGDLFVRTDLQTLAQAFENHTHESTRGLAVTRIGTLTQSVTMDGTAARTVGMSRNTTAATAGQGLSIDAGGAIAGTADLAGGNLTLKSGISTGSATSSIILQTPTPSGSGTSDNSLATRLTVSSTGAAVTGAISASTTVTVGTNLLMPSAGVINFNSGNYTITHSAGLLTTNGALTIVGALAGVTSLTLSGAISGGTTAAFTGITHTLGVTSTTAFATPSALSATQSTHFASTVSGASVMGYGTTNDVTLMNRAGTAVLGVVANTTGVTMAGSVDIATTLTFVKETAHTVQITDTTTADTVGATLTIKAAAGLGTGNGGGLSLVGGLAGVTGTGGAATLVAGAGGATSGNGGTAFVRGGAGTTNANGGLGRTLGGAGAGTGTGGGADLIAGAGGATGAGGNVTITAGSAGGGTAVGGIVTITPGNMSGASTIGYTKFADGFNVHIGTVAVRGTTEPTNGVSVYNGTAPVGTLTNGFTLHSASGFPRFLDSAGNAYLFSTAATLPGSLTITGALAGITSATFSTNLISTTALATPSALSATQFTGFASTVSGATLMGYGTTGDVTLKSRAGTDVFVIRAGSTNATLTAVTINGTGAPAAGKFQVEADSGTNGRYMIFKDTAGSADSNFWEFQCVNSQLNIRLVNDAYNSATNILSMARIGTTVSQINLGGPLAIIGALTGVTTLTTSGAINSQTISSAASFTGSVTVATSVAITGAAAFLGIGSAGSSSELIQIRSTITGNNGVGINLNTTLTKTANNGGFVGLQISETIATTASNYSLDTYSGALIASPTKTGAGAITVAYGLQIASIAAGTNNAALSIQDGGNIELGGWNGTTIVTRSGTKPTNAISLYNGTAPVGTLTNGFTMHSASGFPKFMDAAGNVYLLSTAATLPGSLTVVGALAGVTTLAASGALTLGAKATTYNNIATAGWGVSTVYGSGQVTAQTARSAAIATYTVGAADGSFRVSGNINVSASATHSFSLDVVYTDETNTSRTLILPMAQLAGAFVTGGLVTNVTGVGPYESPVMHIRCKASTTITIRPSAGTFTSVTYSGDAAITQVS